MLRVSGIIIATLLFLASLGFNTLMLSRGDSSFLLGFVCLLFGFSYVAWYANPLFLLAIIFLLLKRPGIAVATSAASLILAVTTLLIRKAPFNEAGHMADVVGYGPGFYLWLASISAILLASVLSTTLSKAKHNITPPRL